MLYEVREYIAVPGRLDDIIALFTGHTVPLFARYDMTLVQVGRTMIGDHSFGELVYTMSFADLAEMEKKWGAFLADPEWIAAATASVANGPLIQSMKRRVLDSAPFAG